jgi:hypothetical protein
MRIAHWAVILLTTTLAVGASANGQGERESSGARCRPQLASSALARSVAHALAAKRDVWGNALLAAPNGPTYAGAKRYLPPLLLARGPRGRPLTESGFHYVAFTQPNGPGGSGSAALHVADGSQVVARRHTGASLKIGVGREGRERYGSCLARLALPRLAGGYLPILQPRYVDSEGARYSQESFAARTPETGVLVSYVRVLADARHARSAIELNFSATGGAAVRHEVPARTLAAAYVSWSERSGLTAVGPETYDAALRSVGRFWDRRLSAGAVIEVPEKRVMDAQRSLLVQNLGLGWRYSVGNPYQQFSYPEALDVAQVLAAHGFPDVVAATLRRSLTTARGPYPSWRIGQKLVTAAVHYRLFRDGELVHDLTPALRRDVGFLRRQRAAGRHGLLVRERYSSDIPDLVHGLHTHAVVWQGLRAMSRVWSDTGRPGLGARAAALAGRLEAALRRAVRKSERALEDGSLFVPMRLLDDERPADAVTQTRVGSYWNLVAPYALASGLFPPRDRQASGAHRYLQLHGARLLGLVRAGAFSLYGRARRYPQGGVNAVYGLNAARFLADNDRPDQLVLSLYGQLAAGMSPGTFVSGEAASVSRLRGDHYRSMYLPPNAASNASFLETLRLVLVHETRDRAGRPAGLELAFATPRAWLAPGRRIVVRDLPTSFGPISYSIESHGGAIRAAVDAPTRARMRELEIRLRLPTGKRMSKVVVNGAPWSRFDARSETIDLSGEVGRVEVEVMVDAD